MDTTMIPVTTVLIDTGPRGRRGLIRGFLVGVVIVAVWVFAWVALP